jgi:hypothetical protein
MLIILAFYCQFNFFSRSTKDLRSLLRHFGFFFLGSVLTRFSVGAPSAVMVLKVLSCRNQFPLFHT